MLNAPTYLTGLTEFLWGLMFCVYCATLGLAVLQTFKAPSLAGQSELKTTSDEVNLALVIFLATCTGIAIVSQLLFLLGLAKLLSPSFMAIALLSLWLLACMRLWITREKSSLIANWKFELQKGSTGVIFLSIGLTLTWLCIKPPGMWDDTSYHLPYAKHYLQEHQLSVNPWLRFPLFPHNGNLLFTLALTWGNEIRAQVIATAVPLTLTAIGIYGICEHFLKSRLAAWIAIAILLSLPPIKDTMGYAYIDNLLMMFSWAAMVSMAITLRKKTKIDPSLIFICGLLAGTAAGTKLFGAVISILIGLCFGLNFGLRKKHIYIYATTVAIFGLGWYIRSYYISGDPIHPAGGEIFGYYLWAPSDLISQQTELATHGASKKPWLIVNALQTAGILTLLPTLFIIFQPRLWTRPLIALGSIVLIYLFGWQLTSQVSRYTTTVLPAAAFLTVAWFYYAGPQELLQKFYKWCLPAKFLYITSLILTSATLPYCTMQVAKSEIEKWTDTLESRNGFKIMQVANSQKNEMGSRLIQIGFENAIYFFDGQVIGDWFGPGRYTQILTSSSELRIAEPEKLKKVLELHEANMIAINGAKFKFTAQDYEEIFNVQKISNTDFLLTLKTRPTLQH
jgi:hypothetical protein